MNLSKIHPEHQLQSDEIVTKTERDQISPIKSPDTSDKNNLFGGPPVHEKKMDGNDLTKKYLGLMGNLIGQKAKEQEEFTKTNSSNTDTMSLGFNNLNIWAFNKKRTGCCKSKNELKWILHNLSGKFEPGTLTAIIGPSGSGKTTLLNFLSQRLEASNQKMNGDIYINGEKMKNIDKVRSKIGYVTQFDSLLPKSTLFESFTFAANLIYNNILSKEEISDIVESMINQLRLEKCRNSFIGSEAIRGLSGGERKRVAIGIELIGNPSLLFMDEPTTGLDASTALEVIEVAKLLIGQKKTIITTIHSASFEILNCFDNIITMISGHIVYWGPPKGIPIYLSNIGLKMPAKTNPADYMMRVVNESDILITNQEARRKAKEALGFFEFNFDKDLNHDEKKSEQSNNSGAKSIIDMKEKFKIAIQNDPSLEKILPEDVKRLFAERCELFRNTYQRFKKIIDFKYDPKKETIFDKLIVPRKKQSKLYEFKMLIKREYMLYARDKILTVGIVGLWVFHSVIKILVFNNMVSVNKDTIQGIFERSALLFSGLFLVHASGMTNATKKFLPAAAVYKRELLGNLYHPVTCFITNFLYTLPVEIQCHFAFINTYFWITTLEKDPGHLILLHMLNNVIIFIASSSMGYILAALIKNARLLQTMVPALILPFMVTAGFLVQVNSMPGHMFGFSYLSICRWGWQAAICIDMFKNDRYKTIRENCVIYDKSTKTSVPVNYLEVPQCDAKNSYDFNESGAGCEWTNMGMNLLLFCILFPIGAIIFYIVYSPGKVKCDELPEEILIQLKNNTERGEIKHEDFKWELADEFLEELNKEEEIEEEKEILSVT